MKKGLTAQAVFGRAILMSVLACGLLLQGAVQAQISGKSTGRPERSSKTGQKANNNKAESPRGAGGPREGIHVHGHWVIDVRNPDGTLVTHREFENSYNPSNQVLASFLGRTAVPGNWAVQFLGQTAQELYELDPPSYGGNLAIQVSGATLTLSGSVSASVAGTVSSVQTILGWCSGGNVAPLNCNAPGAFPSLPFTQTAISPISVAVGQIIQATVTITFS
jgi:hypothetical protein